MGLFLLTEQRRKFTHSRYNERIYLNQYDNIPIEDGYYILNCSSGRKEESSKWTRSDVIALISTVFGILSFLWAVIATFAPAILVKKNI
ncbi:unnamed protein product [Rotaria socialis]|nr:unnamed protein product [Rotaria socialis]CAF3494222.1 unnamed protein product [Rotaria socialis]CAF3568839.1 unnamed protein product [Rotaria socialis]CAF3612815.1 unnamed protein product [Rotaria socialis]